jgi:hypothetical protein
MLNALTSDLVYCAYVKLPGNDSEAQMAASEETVRRESSRAQEIMRASEGERGRAREKAEWMDGREQLDDSFKATGRGFYTE